MRFHILLLSVYRNSCLVMILYPNLSSLYESADPSIANRSGHFLSNITFSPSDSSHSMTLFPAVFPTWGYVRYLSL
jgi:hypothetical protein